MVSGLYIVIARGNMVKKLVGLSLFQTSVYLLYISAGKVTGGTAPIVDPRFTVYSHPLPHVLILTAIVVGVATLALGLALVVRINEAYGTIEEDEIFATRTRNEGAPPGAPGRPAAVRRAARGARRAAGRRLAYTAVVSVACRRRRGAAVAGARGGPISYRIGGWDPSLGIEYRVTSSTPSSSSLSPPAPIVVARLPRSPPRSRRTRSPGSTPCISWR